MATAEELREAVLWTGGIDCINSQAFCWAIIVSLPFDSYYKKDLDWMTSLTSGSFGGRCQPCCKELEQERAARQASVMNAALFGC